MCVEFPSFRGIPPSNVFPSSPIETCSKDLDDALSCEDLNKLNQVLTVIARWTLGDQLAVLTSRTGILNYTPLHVAAQARTPEYVNALLSLITGWTIADQAAVLNAKDAWGRTSFHTMTFWCSESARALLDTINHWPIPDQVAAVNTGKASWLDSLILNPTAPGSNVRSSNFSNLTLLLEIVAKWPLEARIALLDKNYQNGSSPLRESLRLHQENTAESLLRAGATSLMRSDLPGISEEMRTKYGDILYRIDSERAEQISKRPELLPDLAWEMNEWL